MFENRGTKVTKTTRESYLFFDPRRISRSIQGGEGGVARSIIRSKEEIVGPKSERTVKEWKEKRKRKGKKRFLYLTAILFINTYGGLIRRTIIIPTNVVNFVIFVRTNGVMVTIKRRGKIYVIGA